MIDYLNSSFRDICSPTYTHNSSLSFKFPYSLVEPSEVYILKELGVGKFSSIYLVEYNKEYYALKILSKGSFFFI